MNIDKLKAECDEAIQQAYREGWKAGYLGERSGRPDLVDRLRKAWILGFHDGDAEREREEEQEEDKEDKQ